MTRSHNCPSRPPTNFTFCCPSPRIKPPHIPLAAIVNAVHRTGTYFTPVIKQLTGRPAKYFARGLESWNEIVHPDDRLRWRTEWQRVCAGTPIEIEYRIIWPDGSIRWLRETVWADHRGGSNLITLRGITTDITPVRLTDINLTLSRNKVLADPASVLSGIQ